MRTPGRCTNVEGCWISASHRNVWLSVGEEFVCPNCGGALSAPLPETRSYRAVKRVATLGAVGAVAALGLVVVGVGTVKLATISWPGQYVAAAVVHAPEAIVAATMGPKPAAKAKAMQVASDDAGWLKPLTASGEGTVSRIIVSKTVTEPLTMLLTGGPKTLNQPAHTRNAVSTSATNLAHVAAITAPTPAPGQLIIYPPPSAAAPGAEMSGATSRSNRPDTRHTDSAANEMSIASIITVAEAPISPAASNQAPVVLDITYGKPPGPETDEEPVIRTWSRHGIVSHRHSGFLPAATAQSRPASADAIAQICRIPSLLH